MYMYWISIDIMILLFLQEPDPSTIALSTLHSNNHKLKVEGNKI